MQAATLLPRENRPRQMRHRPPQLRGHRPSAGQSPGSRKHGGQPGPPGGRELRALGAPCPAEPLPLPTAGWGANSWAPADPGGQILQDARGNLHRRVSATRGEPRPRPTSRAKPVSPAGHGGRRGVTAAASGAGEGSGGEALGAGGVGSGRLSGSGGSWRGAAREERGWGGFGVSGWLHTKERAAARRSSAGSQSRRQGGDKRAGEAAAGARRKRRSLPQPRPLRRGERRPEPPRRQRRLDGPPAGQSHPARVSAARSASPRGARAYGERRRPRTRGLRGGGRQTMTVPAKRGARGFARPRGCCWWRLCPAVGTWGGGRRPERKGWRGGRNAKPGRAPGSSTPQMGVHPPCTDPREKVPPRYAGKFFALGGGSAEVVADSGWGETQGGLFSALGGLAGVRRGQGDAPSSGSLRGAMLRKAGVSTPCPVCGAAARGSHPACGGDASEQGPACAGSLSRGAALRGWRNPSGLRFALCLCRGTRRSGAGHIHFIKLIRKNRDGRKPVRSRLPYPAPLTAANSRCVSPPAGL